MQATSEFSLKFAGNPGEVESFFFIIYTVFFAKQPCYLNESDTFL